MGLEGVKGRGLEGVKSRGLRVGLEEVQGRGLEVWLEGVKGMGLRVGLEGVKGRGLRVRNKIPPLEGGGGGGTSVCESGPYESIKGSGGCAEITPTLGKPDWRLLHDTLRIESGSTSIS